MKNTIRIVAIMLISFINFSALAANECTGESITSISGTIAKGHAYYKHVIKGGQYKKGKIIAGLAMPSSPKVNSISTFENLIKVVMSTSSGKKLLRGRKAYWNVSTGTIVIYDPSSKDCGTAFRPTKGKEYYNSTK